MGRKKKYLKLHLSERQIHLVIMGLLELEEQIEKNLKEEKRDLEITRDLRDFLIEERMSL